MSGRIEFTYGTMNSGKSTLALQVFWQLNQYSECCDLWTFGDRSNSDMITSRVGISHKALHVKNILFSELESYIKVEGFKMVVIDEVQFAKVEFIDFMVNLAHKYGVDFYTFGLASDFQLNLFNASSKLFAIADKVSELPAPAYCWCGEKAKCNGRVENGVLIKSGEVELIGDVNSNIEMYYQVLCREHYLEGNLGNHSLFN
jgi:thymidine kinase